VGNLVVRAVAKAIEQHGADDLKQGEGVLNICRNGNPVKTNSDEKVSKHAPGLMGASSECVVTSRSNAGP
jgi:hypothetical protein